MTNNSCVSEPNGVTGKLCGWVHNLKITQVPIDVQHRAKLLILDGIGCGLIGAHLPWSEKAAQAVFGIEPPGLCSLFGWHEKLSAPAAALLNSTFIQSFEMDDWHLHAPLHSASLLLPALFAATEHIKSVDGRHVSGESYLLAMIVGLEVGPRIGLGIGGAEVLSRGWHSGPIFGGPAVAAAVSKLLGLSPRQTEWAIGTACTQAGGLMSAQFGSMGLLLGTVYLLHFLPVRIILGLSKFLSAIMPIDREAIFKSLGSDWQIFDVLIKPYPLMALLHAPVDCIKLLQDTHKAPLRNLEDIEKIFIELGETAYKHGGWKVDNDRIEVTGAQMNVSYAVAVQLVDGEIIPTSFATEKLNREVLFDLIRKTETRHQQAFDRSLNKTRVTITLQNGVKIMETVDMPIGVQPRLSDEGIIEKWQRGVERLIGGQRRSAIQDAVLMIESLDSLDGLLRQLQETVGSVLEMSPR